MTRWFLFLFIGLISLTSGITPGGGNRALRGGAKILLIGDIHYRNPVGGGDNGVERFKQIITWSNANGIDAWISSGDFTSWGPTDSTVRLAKRDTVTWYLQDTLNCPVYPVPGNHEWTQADTGNGGLYNNFTKRWPEYFSKFIDTNNRGSRWYGRRVANANIHVFVSQNNRECWAGNCYEPNNVWNGDGIAVDDFDGVSDSTSQQREDLKWYVQNRMEWGDWLILAQHRAAHGLVTISIRPDQEGIHVDADSSQLMWSEANYSNAWNSNIIYIEADTHQNSLVVHGNHVSFATCGDPRPKNTTLLADWTSELKMLAISDSAFSTQSGSVLVDTLGAQLEEKTDTEWGVFWVLNFEQRVCTAELYMVQYPLDSAIFKVEEYKFRQ